MLNKPSSLASVKKRPWIKICGLTDPDNALACAKLLPDAMGLVFYEKSPRYVTIDQAARITKILPRHIMTIGVFVDNDFNDIMEKVKGCALKGVQLHGKESPELVDQLKKEHLFVIKSLFAAKEPYLSRAKEYSAASALLVEFGKGILPGGNAESWNYELSRQINMKIPLIIAGGLSPDNVTKAVKTARPFGVDVSSGVEQSPGLKDIHKVGSFIARINVLSDSSQKA
ncbi:MAG: phosphoribosylanthranilate isomerase [Desulfobacteraceae bacterium]|nr:phosphoribosylanthranilate isomerase [Desulfobacteraceae bacterium]